MYIYQHGSVQSIRLDLIAFVTLTSSVTVDWPQVDLTCSIVEDLSAVGDIKRYFLPIALISSLSRRGLGTRNEERFVFSAKAPSAKESEKCLDKVYESSASTFAINDQLKGAVSMLSWVAVRVPRTQVERVAIRRLHVNFLLV